MFLRNYAVSKALDSLLGFARTQGQRLSKYGSLFLTIVVCIVALGLGIFAVGDLQVVDLQAQQMYAVSVLGLRHIGELQYEAQETRRSTLYALTTNDSNRQLEYADQSRAADRHVTEGIAEYLKQAGIPQEIAMGHNLEADWADYLKIRDEVLASILEGSAKEAVDLDLKGGVPSFDRVRQDLDSIKRLYDERAAQQLALVDTSSRRSIYRLITVLTLTISFACISIWLVQRSRLAAALQLARLQMDFVASISHELRTPLSVIRSAAENICDGIVDNAEQLTGYGSMIRNQTRQVTDLVNQILLFAATRQRKQAYALTSVPFSQVLDSVTENISELLRDGGFVLEQHIDPDLPELLADPAALTQCLQNLVVNAIKYSGSSKWIGIFASHSTSENKVLIRVQDRGIGIAHSELKRIFEPFYRSPAVSAAQIHGTGLGLALARNIAQAMAGDILVQSELQSGSIFTIQIPVSPESQLRVRAKGFTTKASSTSK